MRNWSVVAWIVAAFACAAGAGLSETNGQSLLHPHRSPYGHHRRLPLGPKNAYAPNVRPAPMSPAPAGSGGVTVRATDMPGTTPTNPNAVDPNAADPDAADPNAADRADQPPVPPQIDDNVNLDDFDIGQAPTLAGAGGLGDAGLSGYAPNMIGDFYTVPSAPVVIDTRAIVRPLDQNNGNSYYSPIPFNDPSDLQAGIGVAGPTNIEVTLLDSFVDPRNGNFYPATTSQSVPLNNQVPSFTVRTNEDAAEIIDGDPVTLTNPVPGNEAAIQQGFRDYTGLDGTITFDGGTANVAGGGPYTASGLEYTYTYSMTMTPEGGLPAPGSGGAVGRSQVSDNNSPLPRNRVFLDYNFFHNARLAPGGVSVNRWTPGVERTFLGDLASIEVRMPMALTMSSDVRYEGGTELQEYELGNLTVFSKFLLHSTDKVFYTAGVGVTAPTADDVDIRLNGAPLASFENESVHIIPYVAALWLPDDVFFVQGFAQLDVDANGSTVYTNPTAFNTASGTLSRTGKFQDQTLAKFDLSGGAWFYRNPEGRLTALATTIEAHYTTTISGADSFSSSDPANPNTVLRIGDASQTFDVLNMTVGSHWFFGDTNVLTVGYGFPVTEDKFFDGELRAFVTKYF